MTPGNNDADEVQVQVKSVNHGFATFYCTMLPGDTIRALTRRIREVLHVEVGRQRIVHKGRVLHPLDQIKSAGLVDWPTVYLVTEEAAAVGAAPHAAPTAPAAATAATAAEGAEGAPREAAQGDADDDDRRCRICFSGESEPRGALRLFSPCLCDGSMKYVHVGCLNEWRRASTNPRSYFECDQCRYKYNLRRSEWAEYVETWHVVNACTAAAFVLSTLALGLVNLALPVTIKFYALVGWSGWAGYGGAICDHIVCGLILIGVCGFAVGQRWRDTRFLMYLGMTIASNGNRIFRVFVAVGIAYAVYELHNYMQLRMRELLHRFGEHILGVGNARPPMAAQDAAAAEGEQGHGGPGHRQ